MAPITVDSFLLLENSSKVLLEDEGRIIISSTTFTSQTVVDGSATPGEKFLRSDYFSDADKISKARPVSEQGKGLKW